MLSLARAPNVRGLGPAPRRTSDILVLTSDILVLLSQIYRWWRPHPRRQLSKARADRSRLRNLPWRCVKMMTSPAILSDPFRGDSGDGASSGYQAKAAIRQKVTK